MGIDGLFAVLFFIIPLIFYPKSSEVFEFNKLVATYILTVLIIGLWVIRMILNKKVIFKRTLLDFPLIFFLLSQILSTIFSIDIHTSIFGYYSRWNGGLLTTLAYCLLYWAFVSNVNKNSLKKIIYLSLISATLVSVYAILEHFGHSISCIFVSGTFDDSCWYQDVKLRVFASLGQPNWLAAYLTALIPFSWHRVLMTKTNQKKAVWISISLLMFLGLVFTKSRSGLLALGVETVVFWGFILVKSYKKTIPLFLILLVSSIALYFVFNLNLVTPPTTPSSSVTTNGEGGTESGDIRKIVWKGSIDIWRAYPIFGTGVETFAYSYYQFRPKEHNFISEWNFLYNKAHNEYLNFAATTGTVGLLAYVALIGFSLVQILSFNLNSPFKILNSKIDHLRIAVLAGFASILVTNFFGFSVVPISLLFFLMPAFTESLENKKSAKILIGEYEGSTKQKVSILLVVVTALFTLFCIGKYWFADLHYSLGKSYLAANEYRPSIENLLAAVNTIPQEAVYHADLANAYSDVALLFEDNNDATAAAKLSKASIYEISEAITLSPRNVNIRYTASNILTANDIFNPTYLNDAIELLELNKTLTPTDPKLFLTLGRLYKKAGQKVKARQNIEEAYDLKPDYFDLKKELQGI